GAAALARAHEEGTQLVAVPGLEAELARIEGAAGDRRDRWPGIVVEAHAADTSARRLLRVGSASRGRAAGPGDECRMRHRCHAAAWTSGGSAGRSVLFASGAT